MFVIYDPKTGAIKSTIVGPEPEGYGAKLTETGDAWLFEPKIPADITKDYVDVVAKKIVKRPEMSLSADSDVVRGIPKGAEVIVLREDAEVARETVQDGEVDLETATAGQYTILVRLWPYLPATLTVTR